MLEVTWIKDQNQYIKNKEIIVLQYDFESRHLEPFVPDGGRTMMSLKFQTERVVCLIHFNSLFSRSTQSSFSLISRCIMILFLPNLDVTENTQVSLFNQCLKSHPRSKVHRSFVKVVTIDLVEQVKKLIVQSLPYS